MIQHFLVFLTIIALIALLTKTPRDSIREEERKPVAGKSRAKVIKNKGKRRRMKKLLARAGH